MSGDGVALVWDGDIEYDFGPQHPLKPVRVELTVELIEALGLTGRDGVRTVRSGPYDEDELLRLHRPDYVRTVQRIGEQLVGPSSAYEYGLGPGDNPTFYGMHDASMQVCAASKQAARSVWEGEAVHAFNPAGGLHHALPDRASGFCIYNDPAGAIDWLLEHGAERIAYVDVDVHHGDGVEVMFYDDPRILTVSLHESGRWLFPGTGFPNDIGGEGAEGSAANICFAPGTTGDVWLSAFDAAVDPLVRAFQPDILVTQLGCDTHARDPLAHLALTTDDYAAIASRLHGLAHDAAGGRWVATGGGGYELCHVVPRAWSIHFSEMVGAPLPSETPAAWRRGAEARGFRRPPRSMLDGTVEVGEETKRRAMDLATESVETVRQLVLRRHGIV